jgi:DNA-binding HxlR family transcriptional regulator
MKLDKEYEDLKSEISKFRIETRQRLEAIESQLNKQIKLNYNRTTVDYLTSFTSTFINSMKCEYEPGYEKTCKEKMLSLQHEYTDLLRTGRLAESSLAIEKAITVSKQIKESFQNEEKKGCARCFDNEINGLEINRVLLSQLMELDSPYLATDENKVLISRIEPAEVDKEFLNPLSHRSRLTVMLSIYEGENHFSDFMKKTGLSGGHLIYHLKILDERGLIKQFASKEYVLTSKGLNSLVMVANMNSMLKINHSV